jgi:hypothetical protein
VSLQLLLVGIGLIGWGCNKLTDWGVLLAGSRTSSDLRSLLEAPILLGLGVMLVKALFLWSRKRLAVGGSSLIAVEAFRTSQDRCVLFSVFIVGVLSAAITFVIPLYMETVQGRTSLFAAVAFMPFAGASFAAGALVVQLRGRLRPRRIARCSFLLLVVGAALLGETMGRSWSDVLMITGMVLVGLGEGALSTLLFKFLITPASGDVDRDPTPVCNTTDYFAAAVGTALASALVIGVLGGSAQSKLLDSPSISAEVKEQINLDNVSFVSNEQLRKALSRTTASPPQVEETVRINTLVRLHALRVCFFTLAVLAALAFFPGAALPDWTDS